MLAIRVENPGPDSRLVLGEVPTPSPGPGEVLLRVTAAGVNRADLGQRAGVYPPPAGASEILGMEVSGTVVGLGQGVTGVAEGDEVCALLSGGGYAEHVVVDAGLLLPVPEGVDLISAAALPETSAEANPAQRGSLGTRGVQTPTTSTTVSASSRIEMRPSCIQIASSQSSRIERRP